ncbi:RING finger protein narya-like [Anopheles aquasalis]|uniref:RING finger protein narya-like n=1 Tax=Anopheles aquasalis TaxID=42839 RepID=UPI00215ADF14|nr:RING finger protein narya-like [Anopheles aquasalis]
MSRPRWIHCNVCFHLQWPRDRTFYQLSCRHVLCKLCMSKTKRATVCPICRQSILRFTELSNEKMTRKDKMMFDVAAVDALDWQSQSLAFQHKQREHLIEKILRCRNELPKLSEMEDELRKRIVEAQRRYEKLRNYRRTLQENLRQISPRFNNSALPPPSSLLSTPASGHRAAASNHPSLQTSTSGAAHSNRGIDLRCSQRSYGSSSRVSVSNATSRTHTETRAKLHAGNDSGISTHTPQTRANFTGNSAGRSSGPTILPPGGHRRSQQFLQTPKR